jgi:magnesium transporter
LHVLIGSEEEDLSEYYNDLMDHINKALEVLESSKETIEIYKDTDFMLNTEKSNQILSILTIVFTFSIPVAVIGTFYGMNINLPGGIETGLWTFFGTYATLIVVLIIFNICINHVLVLLQSWVDYIYEETGHIIEVRFIAYTF